MIKNTMKTTALVATVLLLVAIAAEPARAACAVPGPLSTRASAAEFSYIWRAGWPASGGTYGYVYGTPAIDHATFGGVFWGIGTGNPTAGAGDDNGTWQPLGPGGWVQDRGADNYYYGAEIPVGTGWGTNAGVDGCILNNTSRCTCVLLTQNGADGPQFALFSGQGDVGASTLFNQPGNAPIEMAPIPAPVITQSTRLVNNDLMLDITVPSAGGVYEDTTGCPQTCGLKFRIKQFIRPRGQVGSPTDENVGSYTDVANHTPTALDATATGIQSLCGASNNDVWFATQLVTDSGFATPFVSAASTKVECGPTLAEPEKQKPFPVEKPLIERPGRTGRTGR